MAIVEQKWVCNFSPLFRFAEKYGVSWNEANNIFFNGILDYKGYNYHYLDDIGGALESGQYDEEPNLKKGYEILRDFMIETGVNEVLFLND